MLIFFNCEDNRLEKKEMVDFLTLNDFRSDVDRRHCSQTQITGVVKGIARLNSMGLEQSSGSFWP